MEQRCHAAIEGEGKRKSLQLIDDGSITCPCIWLFAVRQHQRGCGDAACIHGGIAQRRILRAFRAYEVQAGWEVDRWERNYGRLQPRHRALLAGEPAKCQRARHCIAANQHLIRSAAAQAARQARTLHRKPPPARRSQLYCTRRALLASGTLVLHITIALGAGICGHHQTGATCVSAPARHTCGACRHLNSVQNSSMARNHTAGKPRTGTGPT